MKFHINIKRHKRKAEGVGVSLFVPILTVLELIFKKISVGTLDLNWRYKNCAHLHGTSITVEEIINSLE